MKNRNFKTLGALLIFIAICLFTFSNCGEKNALSDNKEEDSREESSTTNIKPVDPLFLDFKNNWRNYIHAHADLQLPVRTAPKDSTGQDSWNPLVFIDCIFSEDAGAFVPHITVSWNEAEYKGAPKRPQRVDLSAHPDGFERGYHTTVYPIAENQRFKLLQNSGLAKDEQAVSMAGPYLFPRFLNYIEKVITNQNIVDPNEGQLKKHDLLMQELSAGLSYTIRICELEGQSWTAVKQYVFTTPACTQKF